MDLFIVGAGYVGLTTAVVLAQLGNRVVVHDVDEERVRLLAGGRSPIFEPGLEDAIRAEQAAARLSFTADPTPATETDVAIVCVPTPGRPDGLLDTSIVESVVTRLSAALPADRTIAVRSTLPLHGPDRLQPFARSGAPTLLVNPEFMREGHALADSLRPSRVAVGHFRAEDAEAARRFAALYAPLEAPTIIGDARSVVLLKLASNVFLSAKIAFADELARLCDAIGADVTTVVDGLGLDPRIGRSFLDAGPGFGGSCLPEQAAAIAVETASRALDTPLLGSIARSNQVHQAQLVDGLAASLPSGLPGARVALLGLSFKANTDDVRFSPALALAREVRSRGGSVVGYDPVAAAAARRADGDLETADSIEEALRGADAVLVATEWPQFRELDWPALAPLLRGDLVFDTRRVLPGERVRAAGLRYVALGQREAAAAPVS